MGVVPRLLQVELKDTLTRDTTYRYSMYISLADNVKFASTGLGVFITNHPIGLSAYGLYMQKHPPQYTCEDWELLTDPKEWKLISFEFDAEGGEKFLTIGNFFDEETVKLKTVNPKALRDMETKSHSAYYYIDDVVLEEVYQAIPSMY